MAGLRKGYVLRPEIAGNSEGPHAPWLSLIYTRVQFSTGHCCTCVKLYTQTRPLATAGPANSMAQWEACRSFTLVFLNNGLLSSPLCSDVTDACSLLPIPAALLSLLNPPAKARPINPNFPVPPSPPSLDPLPPPSPPPEGYGRLPQRGASSARAMGCMAAVQAARSASGSLSLPSSGIIARLAERAAWRGRRMWASRTWVPVSPEGARMLRAALTTCARCCSRLRALAPAGVHPSPFRLHHPDHTYMPTLHLDSSCRL